MAEKEQDYAKRLEKTKDQVFKLSKQLSTMNSQYHNVRTSDSLHWTSFAILIQYIYQMAISDSIIRHYNKH